jgi:hypothetical protein
MLAVQPLAELSSYAIRLELQWQDEPFTKTTYGMRHPLHFYVEKAKQE